MKTIATRTKRTSKLVTYRYCGPKKNKRKLVIDNNTALWMARMIVGEGGRSCSTYKATAIITAIINRFFLWPGRRFYPSFIRLMRAFSQPINPRWMTGGDLVKKYAGRSSTSAARLRRRARICALRWRDIPRSIREVVRAAQYGSMRFTSPDIKKKRISNWASLPSTPKKFPWGVDIKGDWFFEDKNLINGVVLFSANY